VVSNLSCERWKQAPKSTLLVDLAADCMCSLFHLALGNEDGGFQLVCDSACCLAWGVIF